MSAAPYPVEGARDATGANVAQGALSLLSTQPLTWAASLLTTVYLPHYLGAALLGTYATLFTAASLAGTVASLGVPTLLTRRVATQNASAAVDTTRSFILLTAAGLLVALVLASTTFLLRIPVATELLGIVLVGMVISNTAATFSSLLIAQRRLGRFAWLNAGFAVVGAIGGVAALAMGAGFVGFLAVGLVCSSLSFIASWRVSGFRLVRSAFNPRPILRLARAGLPFLGWSVAQQVRAQIDVVLVAMILGTSAAGWLAAAYRIIFIPIFIPTLVITPLLPALSRVAHDRVVFQQILQRSLSTVLLMTVPCSAGIAALAPSVPQLLHWPVEFSHSIPLMMILSSEQPIVALDMVLGVALMSLRMERRWLCVGVVAAIFNPVMNLALVPVAERLFHAGVIGATLVELATELVMLAGALFLLPRGILGRETMSAAVRIVLAGLAVMAVAWVIRPWSLPLAIVAGVAVYLVLGMALRFLLPCDLRALFNLLRQRRGRVAAEASG